MPGKNLMHILLALLLNFAPSLLASTKYKLSKHSHASPGYRKYIKITERWCMKRGGNWKRIMLVSFPRTWTKMSKCLWHFWLWDIVCSDHFQIFLMSNRNKPVQTVNQILFSIRTWKYVWLVLTEVPGLFTVIKIKVNPRGSNNRRLLFQIIKRISIFCTALEAVWLGRAVDYIFTTEEMYFF